MIDIAKMEKTTEAIIKARRVLADAREHVIIIKEVLADKTARIILNGECVGKNEKERDASLRFQTINHREALLEAEKRERAAILELEVCKDIRSCQENLISIELGKEA